MEKAFKIIGIALVLVMVVGVLSTQARTKQKRRAVKKEKIIKKTVKNASCALLMVEYSYQGMMREPFTSVRVEREAGKVVLTAFGTIEGDEKFDVNDGEILLQEAEKIILEEKMLDYAASYSLDSSIQVLDGSSWSFRATFADGRKVNSTGQNVSPEGKGLGKMRMLLYDKAEQLLNAKHGN